MVRLTCKLFQKFKNPEMIRKPTPNFQHGYQKQEQGAYQRPQSAQGIPFANMQVNSMQKINDTPMRAELRKLVCEDLNGLKLDSLIKTERIMTTAQSTKVSIKGNQLRILNFCSNNYLGLSNNPEIIKFSKNIMVQYGAGMSSVRHISGTQDIHKDLEKQISKFHEREDAMLYNSCYDANTGVFNSLLTSQDAVFMDENSHCSLKDGVHLCEAQKHFYKNRNVQDLENQLKACNARLKLIATNGVFPEDATIAPLQEIVELAEKYKAVTLIDDCHGTGVLGSTGLGTEEHCGIKGRIDIINSSLGKALGGAAGGYTTGPMEVISLLRQKSRPYLCSNSLPPSMVACGHMALEILMRSDSLVKKVQDNADRFRNKVVTAGFEVLGDNHPICPVVVGDSLATLNFADKIQWRGTFVMPLTYPLAPKDKPVIRVIISAAHSTDDIDRAVEAFTYMGKSLKVIP